MSLLSITVDGVLTQWSDWSSCSETCGDGLQFRTRECEPPQYGGNDCEGDLRDAQGCNEVSCPGKQVHYVIFDT